MRAYKCEYLSPVREGPDPPSSLCRGAAESEPRFRLRPSTFGPERVCPTQSRRLVALPSLRRANSTRRRCRSVRPTSGDQRRNSCSGKPFLLLDSLRRQTWRQILESGVGLVEIKVHKSSRPVALLSDDDLRAAL